MSTSPFPPLNFSPPLFLSLSHTLFIFLKSRSPIQTRSQSVSHSHCLSHSLAQIHVKNLLRVHPFNTNSIQSLCLSFYYKHTPKLLPKHTVSRTLNSIYLIFYQSPLSTSSSFVVNKFTNHPFVLPRYLSFFVHKFQLPVYLLTYGCTFTNHPFYYLGRYL